MAFNPPVKNDSPVQAHKWVSRRRYAVVVAVSILGVLVSLAAFFVLRAWEEDRVALRFTRAAEDVGAAVHLSLDTNLDTLRAVGALYSIWSEVDGADFRGFVEPLLARNPSIEWFALAPAVDRADRRNFETRTGLAVRAVYDESGAQPVRQGDFHIPLLFVEPLVAHKALLGRDVASIPALEQAAERARDSAEVVVAQAGLQPDTQGQITRVALQAVYERGVPVETVAQRRAHLRGFVAESFSVSETVERSLRRVGEWGIDVYLYELLPEGAEKLLHVRRSPLRGVVAAGPDEPFPETDGMAVRKLMEVAGVRWAVLFVPAPGMYSVSQSWLPWLGLLGGLLYTALLATYLTTSAAQTARSEHLAEVLGAEVEERTRAEEALRLARDQLEHRVAERTVELSEANRLLKREISERLRAEEELQRHQAELAHVARLSTLGEIASGIAHELNQPLAAIVNYSQGCVRRLQTGRSDSQQLLQALEQVRSQAERAGDIIRRLRNFARQTEPQRTRENINAVVREVLNLIDADRRKRGVSLELELGEGLPAVQVNMIEIEQVVLNLVLNAFEAMDANPPENRTLRIRTEAAGEDTVAVSVMDNGPGLSKQDLDHIFDPFYSTKAQSLGMGLSISRSIVEGHGGRLRAVAHTGGGLFRFTLPAARSEAQAEAE